MINKSMWRLRWLVLFCVLAGGLVSAGGSRFVSFAQDGGYWCPPEYATCSSYGGIFQPITPIGGGGGGGATSPCSGTGKWVCPVKSVGSEGIAGGTCTSTGCRKYSTDYPVWVCAFTPSDANTKCPPLESCECR
jgi:hypothetical protein